jgi:hypothetical protein
MGGMNEPMGREVDETANNMFFLGAVPKMHTAGLHFLKKTLNSELTCSFNVVKQQK